MAGNCRLSLVGPASGLLAARAGRSVGRVMSTGSCTRVFDACTAQQIATAESKSAVTVRARLDDDGVDDGGQ